MEKVRKIAQLGLNPLVNPIIRGCEHTLKTDLQKFTHGVLPLCSI